MVSSVKTSLRRIAVHAAGSKMDLVVPATDALGHALSVAGVRLAPGDHVHGPGGAAVDPQTSAIELVEGGVYSVTRGRAAGIDEARESEDGGAHRRLPWALVACGLTTAVVTVPLEDPMWRWIAAGALIISALISALIAGARTTERSGPLELAPGLLLGGLAGMLCAPRTGSGGADITGLTVSNVLVWESMFAIALAFAGTAVIAVILSATARGALVRAGAATVGVICVLVAVAAAAFPLIERGPQQFAIVVSAASVLAIRALPALLVNADDGYFIDYGKFMSLRWTVRGKVPRYIERVQNDQVRDLVTITEFRLRTAILLLSLLAVPGIAAAVLPLTEGNLIERISAGVFLIFSVSALMLVSRRTVAPMLRRPQRLAAFAGALGAVFVLGGTGAVPGIVLLIGAGVLLIAGTVIAAGSVSLLRGARSLGWSRTADIVESITVVFVMPAGLVAAGAIEVLRGVLS
ncbi:MAG: hypothetical protein ACTIJ6_00570 [Leucobacter sp.]